MGPAGEETRALVEQSPAALLLTNCRDICSAQGTLSSLHGAQTNCSPEQRRWDLGLALGRKVTGRHRYGPASVTSAREFSDSPSASFLLAPVCGKTLTLLAVWAYGEC